MSSIVQGLSKALNAKGFVTNDKVYILGVKCVDVDGNKLDDYGGGWKEFSLKEGNKIDEHLAGNSLLAVMFETKGIFVLEDKKEGSKDPVKKEEEIDIKFVYSCDYYDSRMWRLIRTEANGISYHLPVRNQSDVSCISIDGKAIAYHPEGKKSEALDISI